MEIKVRPLAISYHYLNEPGIKERFKSDKLPIIRGVAPPLSSEHTTGRLFFASGLETRGGEKRLTEHVEGISEAPLRSRKRTVSRATSMTERATQSPAAAKLPHPILKYGVQTSMTGPDQKKKKLVHFPEVALAVSSPPSNHSHPTATRLDGEVVNTLLDCGSLLYVDTQSMLTQPIQQLRMGGWYQADILRTGLRRNYHMRAFRRMSSHPNMKGLVSIDRIIKQRCYPLVMALAKVRPLGRQNLRQSTTRASIFPICRRIWGEELQSITARLLTRLPNHQWLIA
jgi:hypothetical protein